MGKQRIEEHVEKAVYFISAGTNDFVINYFGLPVRRKTYTLQAYQNFLIQHITDFIQVGSISPIMHLSSSNQLILI